MKKPLHIAFRKSDSSQSALNLGIWDTLIEGLKANDSDQIEVAGQRWVD